jgi:ribosome-binding factor A
MSISAVKEPEELEHIKHYFSTVKGINSFNKMNEAVKQWNHATALRGKKPVELKKETMQASTYVNVLTHLTAIKQEILTQVLP